MFGLSGDHMTFFGLVEPGYTLQERKHWVRGGKKSCKIFSDSSTFWSCESSLWLLLVSF